MIIKRCTEKNSRWLQNGPQCLYAFLIREEREEGCTYCHTNFVPLKYLRGDRLLTKGCDASVGPFGQTDRVGPYRVHRSRFTTLLYIFACLPYILFLHISYIYQPLQETVYTVDYSPREEYSGAFEEVDQPEAEK
jgi:hypothetical protein